MSRNGKYLKYKKDILRFLYENEMYGENVDEKYGFDENRNFFKTNSEIFNELKIPKSSFHDIKKNLLDAGLILEENYEDNIKKRLFISSYIFLSSYGLDYVERYMYSYKYRGPS